MIKNILPAILCLSKTQKSHVKPFLKHLIIISHLLLLVQYILNSIPRLIDGIYFGIEGDQKKIPKIDELYEMRRYYVEDTVVVR